MRSTLFTIPHEFADLPVFGFGWGLILLAIALIVRLVILRRLQKHAFSDFLSSEAIMWGVLALAVVIVLPMVEIKNIDGAPVGMAIRGYGVMLLIGVLTAVGLAMLRTRRRGIDPEVIINMAPWVFIGGIAGARLFYVIQYRDRFIGDSLSETVRGILTFTEGGLVVYGGFIFGVLAAVFFVVRHRLPVLKLGDAIVPCMFLGLFFGRMGCLLNGCCYGGQCAEYWAALHFPVGSPVYVEQLEKGVLVGLEIDESSGRIESVRKGSLADKAGISSGSRVERIRLDDRYLRDVPKDRPIERAPRGLLMLVDGKTYQWSPDQLPPRAEAVQPAQLISSFSAICLCGLLCAASYVFRREGAIMMLGFASYAVLRFGLEWIRVDEKGQFGTSLSISQWVSVMVLAGSVAGLIWIYRRGAIQSVPTANT
ncbi:prolipoprotein diacylglyceryl transferase [Novipirellula artificiosorum]|uniref:Phosphatidylglycerol--prolipoprotein diacylglyceryl transferase n=1 Tax=Novipirellula artificiosorum TaxID=2528016 RepID=A0A5C6DMG9_9BACT|nr:prolipoprotein diacylglyceryl transferase family protein [Novipirellula artificiosorum]TWU36116.1 Prolipoprotein diacylglyceryl transferase [Novipirellula artificiosorum]